jgi:hypothetical protein
MTMQGLKSHGIYFQFHALMNKYISKFSSTKPTLILLKHDLKYHR